MTLAIKRVHFYLTLVMFLHYLTLHTQKKTENVCSLPVTGVNGFEKNRSGVSLALKRAGCVARSQ